MFMGIWSKAKTVLLGAVIALGGASFLAFGGETPLVADAATVAKHFTKVTSTDDLNDGDTLIFAYDQKVMGANTTSGTRYRTAVDTSSISSSTNDIYTVDDSWAQVVIKGDNSSGFTIQDISTEEYLYYGGSGNSVSSGSTQHKWKFVISGSTFKVQNLSYTSRYLEYNKSAPRWACYTGGQASFYIFEEVPEVTVGEITRIEVRTPPTKVDYYVGDTFSLDGLTVYGYDAEGNSKLLDWQGEDSENFLFGIDHGTVLTEEHKTEGAEFELCYGENLLEPETTWTYSIVDAPEAIRYTLLESPSDLVIGSKVLLGVTANDVDYYASSYAQSGKTRFDVTSESFMANGGDGLIAFDSTDASVRPLEFEVRIADVTDEDGNKVIALYNAEEEYYVDASENDTPLSTSSTFSSNVYLTLKDIGGDYGYGLWGNNNENRGITLGTGDPKYFRNYQLTENSYKGIAAKLYVRSSTGEDQAAELDRYVMESDTKNQCVTKFPVAKDAYLNLMNEEGRTAFASHMDAVTRYQAWATYLGELPYAEGQVQAYMPFAMNQNETGWIIAVAVLASCALLGGGYYFYRKRRSI